jgi:beta-phosphoglucomutase-like phosphatase (HAD superfamily)
LAQFDLGRRFDFIITGDDVMVGKPDPMMFLEVARRLATPPAQCLVLEDAQNGVEAAYRAGMSVFAIPHDASRHHDFSEATRVLSSMKDIDRAMLESLNA